MQERVDDPIRAVCDGGNREGLRMRRKIVVGMDQRELDQLRHTSPGVARRVGAEGRQARQRQGRVRDLPTRPAPPPAGPVSAIQFHPAPLEGACLVEPERRGDDRGFFARLFCERTFDVAGLETRFVQVNNSHSARRGTLRGFHYQLAPSAEVKVVRCIRGAMYDVVADLRPDSPTFGQWFGAELSADNRLMMYVPRGFAHAFVTLTDDVEALYLASEFYAPEQERGLRFDDPWLGVRWPVEPVEISPKDRNWPDFDPEFHGVERLRGLC